MTFLKPSPNPRILSRSLVIILAFVGCAKDEPLGPDLSGLYGELELLTAFSNNSPNGVHFEANEKVEFSADFNLEVDYTLSLIGQSSGAKYSISGKGANLSDVSWGGDCDDVFFGPMEWVHCVLEFDDHPESTQLDSVFVWEQPDLSFKGVLLTSFEDPSAFSLTSGDFTDYLESVNNAPDAVEGSTYMTGFGSGPATWFGALRITMDPSNLSNITVADSFLNLHLRSEFEGSATVIKVFEDSNDDGMINSGDDEVFTTKVPIAADGQWQRMNLPLSDLSLDLSGNNVAVNGGLLELDKILRLDITISQVGTADGTFGFDADYIILTPDEPF